MRETELKLSVDEPFVTPSAEAFAPAVAGMHELPSQELRATYYDTDDLRLARSGLTLRFRSGESEPGWTLKLPLAGDAAIERDEINVAGPAQQIPSELRDLTTAFVRCAELSPVTRLRTRRRRWSLRDSDGTELAELVDDRVTVLEQNRVVGHFRELEVEAREIGSERLRQIGELLSSAGAAPTTTPKALRAMGARAHAAPEVARPEQIGPKDPAAFAVQAAIAQSLRRVIANDPGTRLGDVTSLHQMRVGTRRLRSDLRTFGPLIDAKWAKHLGRELKHLGAMLGEVRDLDVIRIQFEAEGADLHRDLQHLFSQLASRRESARERLLEFLRSDSYLDLIDSLVDASRKPPLTDEAWRPGKEVLPQLAARSAKRFIRSAKSLSADASDDEYHDVRVRAKRTRYATEAIAPALGKRGRPLRKFGARVQDIQELLGSLQDAGRTTEVVSEMLAASTPPASEAIAAGRLVERQQNRAQLARRRFPKAIRRAKQALPSDWG